MSELPGNGLCHYTSGQGLLGMLKDRQIRATHIYYLNDHTEYAGAFDRILQVARSTHTLATRYGESLFVTMEAALARLKSEAPPNIFVTCFSEKRDDLSQWRGYTKSGDGYCMVFDAELLMAKAKAAGWRLEKCKYGAEADGEVMALLDMMGLEHAQNRWTGDADGAAGIARMLEGLAHVAPTIKHDAFEAENEWRLISPAFDEKDLAEKLKFRPGSSFLVPYVTFPFADLWTTEEGVLNQHNVTELWAGPGPNEELAKRSLSTLAAAHEWVLNDCHTSKAPYRSW